MASARSNWVLAPGEIPQVPKHPAEVIAGSGRRWGGRGRQRPQQWPAALQLGLRRQIQLLKHPAEVLGRADAGVVGAVRPHLPAPASSLGGWKSPCPVHDAGLLRARAPGWIPAFGGLGRGQLLAPSSFPSKYPPPPTFSTPPRLLQAAPRLGSFGSRIPSPLTRARPECGGWAVSAAPAGRPRPVQSRKWIPVLLLRRVAGVAGCGQDVGERRWQSGQVRTSSLCSAKLGRSRPIAAAAHCCWRALSSPRLRWP